jgi:hypothetical protein
MPSAKEILARSILGTRAIGSLALGHKTRYVIDDSEFESWWG